MMKRFYYDCCGNTLSIGVKPRIMESNNVVVYIPLLMLGEERDRMVSKQRTLSE